MMVTDGHAYFMPIGLEHVDTLLAIEASAYEFPWSRGNFIDSLNAGYLARRRVDAAGQWLGYFIAMPGVQELHLLNLTVAPAHQRRGHARAMLDRLVNEGAALGAQRVWLEVRMSNERAQQIYRRYGFREIGVRRGYYPAGALARENALVMSLDLTDGAATPAVP
ncbi:MAG TPA: ribosomal protein S18-alanine N-acetyltransferase [Burkholderiaceae bacterium]|nr:ribosomal protein S18-alanine N-acetyltransferase [Burkholderiaceae bacterium]